MELSPPFIWSLELGLYRALGRRVNQPTEVQSTAAVGLNRVTRRSRRHFPSVRPEWVGAHSVVSGRRSPATRPPHRPRTGLPPAPGHCRGFVVPEVPTTPTGPLLPSPGIARALRLLLTPFQLAWRAYGRHGYEIPRRHPVTAPPVHPDLASTLAPSIRTDRKTRWAIRLARTRLGCGERHFHAMRSRRRTSRSALWGWTWSAVDCLCPIGGRACPAWASSDVSSPPTRATLRRPAHSTLLPTIFEALQQHWRPRGSGCCGRTDGLPSVDACSSPRAGAVIHWRRRAIRRKCSTGSSCCLLPATMQDLR